MRSDAMNADTRRNGGDFWFRAATPPFGVGGPFCV